VSSVPTPQDARGRATQLPPALAANLWKPGQSGNPEGFPAKYRAVIALCRETSPESVREIIRLRDNSEDERIRFMCATWLFERAWGKPKDYDQTKEKPQTEFNPGDYTPEELNQIEAALRLIMSRRNQKQAEAEMITECHRGHRRS
jgi:hypothetical protein